MEPTEEMVDHFITRTHYHIKLVHKYADHIAQIAMQEPEALSLVLSVQKHHDASKFEEPEYTPYIWVSWKYHMGLKFPKIPVELEQAMHNATMHHITYNQHHPEYWVGESDKIHLNRLDRDTPHVKGNDATRMPYLALAEMVADWCAVAEERRTCVHDWAKMNIGTRWLFTEEQQNQIHTFIRAAWGGKR